MSEEVTQLKQQIHKLKMELRQLKREKERDERIYKTRTAEQAKEEGYLVFNDNVTHHCLDLRHAHYSTVTILTPDHWLKSGGMSPNRPKKMSISLAMSSQCIDIVTDTVHSEWKAHFGQPWNKEGIDFKTDPEWKDWDSEHGYGKLRHQRFLGRHKHIQLG